MDQTAAVPVTTEFTKPGEGDPDALELSQRAHRRIIGLLGFCLSWLVYLLAGYRPTTGLTSWVLLDSVSAYFYTGATAVFVGVVFALSLFLLTYRGYIGFRADRIVGRIGGAAALVVALFPTKAPIESLALAWFRPWMGVVHYGAAVVLFGCFILFSLWLFRKSSVPDRHRRRADKQRRDIVYLVCGLIMIASLAWAGIASVMDASIFWPESIAILAFSVSWLVKGEAHKMPAEAKATLEQAVAATK